MPYTVPETIKDSVSIYLRMVEVSPQPDSLRWSFGQFEYLATDDSGILFVDTLFHDSIHLLSKGVEGALPVLPNLIGSLFFLLFLFCFITFSIIFNREGVALTENLSAIFSFAKRHISGYKEQVTTAEVWGEIFMILQTVIVLSIILCNYIWFNEFAYITFKDFSIKFLTVFLILSILFGLKFMMYKSISFFFLQKEFKSWVNRYFRLIELLGIILFIPAIIYLYLPEFRIEMQNVIIIVLLMGKMIVMIEILNIFVKNKVGPFYFFVYLCATEIAPLLVFYKGVVLLISIAGNNIV